MTFPFLNDNFDDQLSLQVETVAQFGVIFLLFALGLEFSVVKVGPVLSNYTSFAVPLCKEKERRKQNLKEVNLVNLTDNADSCCASSCFLRWIATNTSVYVFVWDNSLGTCSLFFDS